MAFPVLHLLVVLLIFSVFKRWSAVCNYAIAIHSFGSRPSILVDLSAQLIAQAGLVDTTIFFYFDPNQHCASSTIAPVVL